MVSSHLKLTSVVESILDENPLLCFDLSKTSDLTGRSALDVAIPECTTILLFSLYFHKRFEIMTANKPQYHYHTSIVHIAVDHSTDSKR